MARVPYLSREDVPEDARSLYDHIGETRGAMEPDGAMPHSFQALFNSPGAAKVIGGLGEYMRSIVVFLMEGYSPRPVRSRLERPETLGPRASRRQGMELQSTEFWRVRAVEHLEKPGHHRPDGPSSARSENASVSTPRLRSEMRDLMPIWSGKTSITRRRISGPITNMRPARSNARAASA